MKDRPILVMLGGAVLVTVGLMALRFGAAQLACSDCEETELLPLSISDEELETRESDDDTPERTLADDLVARLAAENEQTE